MSTMSPIPDFMHRALVFWIPKELNGVEYDFIETAQGIARPEVPAIVAWFGGPVPSEGSDSFLRTVRNVDGDLDDYWGQRFFITLFVSLRAYDPEELAGMWLDFIRQIHKQRRDMKLQIYGIEFKEILRNEPVPMDNVPESATGDQVFMAQIDLRFEYEVAEISDADYIRRVEHNISVVQPGDVLGEIKDATELSGPLTFVSEVFERSLTCGLRAYIEEPT